MAAYGSRLTWILLLASVLSSCANEIWVSPSNCQEAEGSATENSGSGSCCPSTCQEAEGFAEGDSGSGSGRLLPLSCTLDAALQSVKSDMTLHLASGVHCIRSFVLLHGWQKVTLIGEAGDVVITCKDGLGLAFVNITDLRLENLQIKGCGLQNSGLNESLYLVREIVDMFIRIPAGVRIALFLGHIHNLWMENINIIDTLGYGLVGINVLGESLVRQSTFCNNSHTNPVCNFGLLNVTLATGLPPSLFGGGAYFLYQDYHPEYEAIYVDTHHTLAIDDSAFFDNSDCSFMVQVALGYKDSELYRDFGYTVGGGGGLTVILSQVNYSVDATISNATMFNNIARFGSGATVVAFAGVTNSHVIFMDNCTFLSNGFPTLDFFSAVTNGTFASGGGGVSVILDAPPPNFMHLTAPTQRNVSVEFFDSFYLENAAYVGGAVLVYSFFGSTVTHPEEALRVRFVRCHFLRNAAVLGAAFWVYELKKSARDQVGLQMELQDMLVSNNIGSQANGRVVRRVQDNPAIVDVRAVNVTFTGEYIFIADNQGTALQASGSLIGILGNNCTVVMVRNTGVYGGAFNLFQMSYLVIMPESILIVHENTARIQGGAFYINQLGSDPAIFSGDCFLFFSYQQFFACQNCSNFNDTELFVSVVGNSAPRGSTIYGSTLECPWAFELQEKYDGENVLDILSTNFPERFTFSPEPVSRQQVITPPQRLRIEGHQTEGQEPYSAAPGETFHLDIAAEDGYNQTISTVIAAYVISSTDNTTTSLGLPNVMATAGSDGFAVLSNRPTSTVFRVFSLQNESVKVALYSVEFLGAAQATFEVHVETCPLGFVFNETSLGCACDPELLEAGIECDVDNLLIIVPDEKWVGPVGGGDNRLVVEDCVRETYCVSGRKSIDVQNNGYDEQCAEDSNRGGLLCGRCQSGYSIVLGSDRCLQCSNSYLGLIVLFLTLGILLIILLSYFRITITSGFLNGILFYSNLVSLFEPILTPVHTFDGRLALTSFLSLSLGIETCFYDKMDALQKVWWQLSFPLYLYILMFIITFVARCCKWKRTVGFSTTQAFATLIVLCYVSIVLSCVELLGGVDVRTVSGDRLSRWIVDPTVTYFEGAHGFLTFVAILLLIFYIIPLPILLLFPTWLYRIPKLKNLKPIYDAFWDPFKPRYRFWLGFRLMFRWLPLVMFYLVPFPVDTFVTGMALLLLLCTQIWLQPFKGTWRNMVDNLFTLNLVVLFFGAIFFEANKDLVGTDRSESQGTAFTTFFVILAYLGFVGVLAYHIIIRYRTLREGVKNFYRRGKDKPVAMVSTISGKAPEVLEPADNQDFQSINHAKHETVAQISTGDIARVNFSVLREPLLEAGSAEIVTIPSPIESPVQTEIFHASKKKRKAKANRN